MRVKYIFNPEHDLCLANGDANYLPPQSALEFGKDCHRQVEQWLQGIMGEEPQIEQSAAQQGASQQSPHQPIALCATPQQGAPQQGAPQPDYNSIDMLVPWGWDLVLRKRLLKEGCPERLIPSCDYIKRLRHYSNRAYAVKALAEIKAQVQSEPIAPRHSGEAASGPAAPSSKQATAPSTASPRMQSAAPTSAPSSKQAKAPSERLTAALGDISVPTIAHTMEEISAAIAKHPHTVLKSPLSGSGKGLRWVDKTLSHSDEGWCRHTLSNMGSVIIEKRYKTVQDYAMLFTCNLPDINNTGDGPGSIKFFGYSLFFTKNGAYTGNIVEGDTFIEEYLNSLAGYKLPLYTIKDYLTTYLEREYGSWYSGFIGIDQFLYLTDEQGADNHSTDNHTTDLHSADNHTTDLHSADNHSISAQENRRDIIGANHITSKGRGAICINPVVEINVRLTMGHFFRHLARSSR